jgi:hypothetical protein
MFGKFEGSCSKFAKLQENLNKFIEVHQTSSQTASQIRIQILHQIYLPENQSGSLKFIEVQIFSDG